MFGSFFVLLALGVPLAWSLLSLAILFGFFIKGPIILPFISLRFWGVMTGYSLIAVPMFVFMANMLRYSGVADDLFDALHHWMGPLKGGLAMATVVSETFIAAMVGIVGGDIVIMTLIAMPAMVKRKYDRSIAIGSIIAGGALGVLIPPSILFILYGVYAPESIGKLFMGGVGPGLLLACLYITYIGIRSYLNPTLGPALPKEERVSFMEKIVLLKNIALPVVLIFIVLGSIYLGIATPSEAAGMGAMGAILVTAARRRLSWTNLKLALFESGKAMGILFYICLSAVSFIGVFALAGGAVYLKELLLGLPFGPWGILIVIMLVLLVLGMVLDVIGIIILTVPIVVPVINALGFDTLWFGILFNVNLQIAFLSPPFGYGLFYFKAVAPETTTVELYKAVWPFIIFQIIGLALIMVFPQIATWLPNQMIK
ncbi:TRAP transporter large permease subunit [Chloroflexota bacterium]